ncbi:ATP-binding cassette domain-containing protein [Actinomyces howellii]|nr:ATP-binding cassette domain-containing protein [Actinomyces howellii]
MGDRPHRTTTPGPKDISTMQHLRLMRLWHGHRVLLVLLTLTGLGVAATWIGQALLTSRVFTLLVAGAGERELVPAVLALAAVLLARPVLVLVRQLLAQHAMTRVKSSVRARALTAFVRRSAVDPAVSRSGRDHAVVVDGVENLDVYLSGYLPQVGVTVLVVAAVGSVMIVVDPVVGAVAVGSTLLLQCLPRLWDRALAARGAGHWDAYQELHAEFVDSMEAMTTLVAFGADRRREAQLARASSNLLARTLGQLRLSLVESGLSGFALAAVPALVLTAVVVRGRELGAFEVFVLVLLSVELVRPLRDLASLWHAGYLGTFSGPRVLDLLDAEPAQPAVSPARSRASGNGLDGTGGGGTGPGQVGVPAGPRVLVRGLTARYPGAPAPALVDVDLELGPGLTAVVGATGSGKSTLAAVLSGLLPPERGRVEIEGGAGDLGQCVRRISLVPQDPVLLGATVGQDIALGLPRDPEARSGPQEDELLARAARTVGIGLDETEDTVTLATPVGDAGARLSGGQRQRVAVARALAQQREVLVLDEATSALDPAAESRLVEALRRQAGRTLVAITHRLDLALRAERVVVLDGGRVAEQGPPEVLLASDGALSALVAAEGSPTAPGSRAPAGSEEDAR